jgi:hypothetical protein
MIATGAGHLFKSTKHRDTCTFVLVCKNEMKLENHFVALAKGKCLGIYK